LVAVVQNFNKTLTPGGSSGETDGGGSAPLNPGTTIALGEPEEIQPTGVPLPEPSLAAMIALGAGAFIARRRH
jgi:hypothetical protein